VILIESMAACRELDHLFSRAPDKIDDQRLSMHGLRSGSRSRRTMAFSGVE
jgi:hypothetical protein